MRTRKGPLGAASSSRILKAAGVKPPDRRADCGTPMLRSKRAPLPEGFVRHKARGRCIACFWRARRAAETPEQRERRKARARVYMTRPEERERHRVRERERRAAKRQAA